MHYKLCSDCGEETREMGREKERSRERAIARGYLIKIETQGQITQDGERKNKLWWMLLC